MTLPDAWSVGGASPDPYGLWEAPAGGEGQAVSYGDLEASAEDADVVAIWRLRLVSGDPSAGRAELDQRAQQLAEIADGLEAAGARIDAFLAQRGQPGGAGPVAFAVGETPPDLPAPEADLALALAAIEAPAEAGGSAAFGIAETAAQVAGAAGVDWNGLQERFNTLMDKVNRQILHAAWVETTLDGCLVARTTINWGGDMTTVMAPALNAATVQAHQAALEQAVASEVANLKTVLTVAQVAGKIALALTTPIGVPQALALAWQFVSMVIRGQ